MPRVLLIAPQWIGDAVMAQPLVALLAVRGEQVTALGLPSVAAVLRAMPGVAEVIEAPFAHGKLDWRLRSQIAAQLRGQGFARAYILGNNLKARLVPWLARIPQRVGYVGEAGGLLLTQRIRPSGHGVGQAEPMALSPVSCRLPKAPPRRADIRDHYAALAQRPGEASPSRRPEPTLAVAREQARAVGARFGLPERWVALCPGAEYGPAKQWPSAHFATLAARAQRAGYAVAVLGTPRDAATGQAIAAQTPGVRNLCGVTQLDEAVALLADCSGAVSNDSGLMHIAAALGRPTVGVYGSTDPRHTPPAAHHSAVLWLQLECSPCFARTCPLGHLHCLWQIQPEAVWEQLQQLLGPPQEASAGQA